MAVTEKEVIDLKNEVTRVRDTVIRAKATKQEVEKNMLALADELASFGIIVPKPELDASEELWAAFYQDLVERVSKEIDSTEQTIGEEVSALRQQIAAWGV